MYPHINHVTMSGRLTKDPEGKYMKTGTMKASLNVACNNRRKVGDNWENNPAFVIVECWGKSAENICERARKGQPILFTGQVTQDQYEKDGKTVRILKFNAQNIMVLHEEAPTKPSAADTTPARGYEPSSNDNDEEDWNEDVPF